MFLSFIPVCTSGRASLGWSRSITHASMEVSSFACYIQANGDQDDKRLYVGLDISCAPCESLTPLGQETILS